MSIQYIFLFFFSLLGVYEIYSYIGSTSQKKHSNLKGPSVKQLNEVSKTEQNLILRDNEITDENEIYSAQEEELEEYFKAGKELMRKESQDKELNFMILGDFGYVDKNKPNLEMKKLGDFIVNRVKKTFMNYDFFVSVGDNFYPFGLDSDHDPKATVLFEDTFQMSSLGLDWYPVLGNHDLLGNYPAALKLHKRFPLWKQTEPYYYKIFNIGNSENKAGFIFLHSCDLVCTKRTNPECYRGTQKNVKFDEIQTQLDWLSDVLEMMSNDPKLSWKIVVIHNAIFSAGERHGDNEDLKDSLLPILTKYKVDLVLSGHDHSVQYLRMDLNNDNELQEEDEIIENSEETICSESLDYDYCSDEEFFHFELTSCGQIKSLKRNAGIKKFYELSGNNFLSSLETKYPKESIVTQHQHLHQFVLGNAGLKHERMCPVKQMESQGKLRYGHSISGIGDVKIKEDRMEVNLMSVENELMYSLKIFKLNSQKLLKF